MLFRKALNPIFATAKIEIIGKDKSRLFSLLFLFYRVKSCWGYRLSDRYHFENLARVKCTHSVRPCKNLNLPVPIPQAKKGIAKIGTTFFHLLHSTGKPFSLDFLTVKYYPLRPQGGTSSPRNCQCATVLLQVLWRRLGFGVKPQGQRSGTVFLVKLADGNGAWSLSSSSSFSAKPRLQEKSY